MVILIQLIQFDFLINFFFLSLDFIWYYPRNDDFSLCFEYPNPSSEEWIQFASKLNRYYDYINLKHNSLDIFTHLQSLIYLKKCIALFFYLSSGKIYFKDPIASEITGAFANATLDPKLIIDFLQSSTQTQQCSADNVTSTLNKSPL